MIKSKISAVLTGVLLVLPCVAGAAYPVYQNYQGAQPMVQGGYVPAVNNRMAQPAVVNNSMVMYNTAYSAFERHYNRTHMYKTTSIKFF